MSVWDDILNSLPDDDSGNVGEAPDEEEIEDILPAAKGKYNPRRFALDHLMKRGLSREDAAAMVLNFTQESGVDLNTKMVHDAGTGLGIAGFRDPTPGVGRRTNLINFARRQGRNVSDLDTQLDFAVSELNGPEARAYAAIRAASTPEAKAIAAQQYFRPAAKYARIRAGEAGDIHAILNDLIPSKKQASGLNLPATTRTGFKRQVDEPWPLPDSPVNRTAMVEHPDSPGFTPIPVPVAGAGEDYDPATADPLLDPVYSDSVFAPLQLNVQNALDKLAPYTPAELAANAPAVLPVPGILNRMTPEERAAQVPESIQADKDTAAMTQAALANMPWMPAYLASLPWTIRQGGKNTFGEGIASTMEENKRIAREMWGAKEEGPQAKIVSGAVGMLSPASAPVNTAMAAMGGLTNLFTPSEAFAASDKGKGAAAKNRKVQETDMRVQQMMDIFRPGAPMNMSTFMFTPKERPGLEKTRDYLAYGDSSGVMGTHFANGKTYVVPMGRDGSPGSMMALVNHAGGLEQFPSYVDSNEAKLARDRMNHWLAPYRKQREISVMTPGGPVTTDMSTLAYYGGTAALATIGLLAGPAGLRYASNLKNRFMTPGTMPSLRTLDYTHPDTAAISTAGDLLKTTTYDFNAGLDAINVRAGMRAQDVNHISHLRNTQSGEQAYALANAAMWHGNFHTANFQYGVNTPMRLIAKQDTPVYSQYINAKNTLEHIEFEKQRSVVDPKYVSPLPVDGNGLLTVRGQNEIQMRQIIRDMEQANPDVRIGAQAHRENVKEVNRFTATGEYALDTPEIMREKNKYRKHYISSEMDGYKDVAPPMEAVTGVASRFMEKRMRQQMENNVLGEWIDLAKNIVLSNGKNLLVPVDAAWVALQGDKVKKTILKLHRRGEPEYWAVGDPFLAALWKRDPYFFSGPMAYINTLKNTFQSTTTGALAPWFAFTSFFRNQKLMRTSAPEGFKSANVLQSAAAIPRQLVPQAAKTLGEWLDTGSGGALRATFGDARIDGFAARMLNRWERSFMASLEASGTHHGSVLQQHVYGNNQLQLGLRNVEPGYAQAARDVGRTLWDGWNAMMQAGHNAPAYAFLRKNRNMLQTMDRNAYVHEGRRLTGNPMAGGQRYTSEGVIPFDAGRYDTDPLSFGISPQVKANIAGKIGHVAEFGRQTIPWFNTTIQGNRRLLQAWIENPGKFTQRIWQYSMMPAAGSYMLSRIAGVDPNGLSYTDYMVNRRSDYDRMMYTYIPIPGLPAERGIKIPNVHEFSMGQALMIDALHHLFASSIYDKDETTAHALAQGRNIMIPGLPIGVSVGAAAFLGQRSPMGMFGGESYTPRADESNQYSLNGSRYETTARAVAGGFMDVMMAGLVAAYSDKDSFISKVQSFASGAGRRTVEKTPVVNSLTGMVPPITARSPTTDAYYENKKAIDELVKQAAKRFDPDAETKPYGSEAGYESFKHFLRPMPTVMNEKKKEVGQSSPGINPIQPQNPVYNHFIERIHTMFSGDDVNKGAIGFKTVAKQMSMATEAVDSLRHTNTGNYHIWQEQLMKDPKKAHWLADLKEYKIDPKNRNAVMSHYALKQQEYAKHAMFMIKSVEDALTAEARQKGLLPPDGEVKFKDLKPFGQPNPKAPPQTLRPYGM